MIRLATRLLSGYIANLKLKHKLMLSYFILIVIPLSAITMINYQRVSGTIQDQTMHSALQVFDQAMFFLSSKINNAENTSNIIILDKETSNILVRNSQKQDTADEADYERIGRETVDRDNLSRFFTNLSKNADIYRIRLYVPDGLIYSNENVNFFNINSIVDLEWYRVLKSFKGHIMWCPSYYFPDSDTEKARVISAARLVKNPNRLTEDIGVLRIDILESSIVDILKNASGITKTGVVYIADDKMNIITASDPDKASKWKADTDSLEPLPGVRWKKAEINGRQAIVHCEDIEKTGWKLVSVIPMSEILSSGNSIRNEMLVLMLSIGASAYLIAWLISRSSTNRIALLARRFKRVQNGDLDAIMEDHGRDEIGELVEDFNFMVKKMRILIENQFKTGQEMKNAELKALQAQINPHFLYNTLDLINWMAMRYKAQDIVFLVRSLSRFYKLSLNKGNDMVTVRNEILHVKTYVDIQNMRFENKIILELDIDENILDCIMPKIILQPVVENSILHGILQKEDKSGIIRITGRLSDDMIILTVEDDGVGMDSETIDRLLSSDNTQNTGGYGVKNINDRIQILYGNSCGIKYSSEEGRGTRAEIRIPAIR